MTNKFAKTNFTKAFTEAFRSPVCNSRPCTCTNAIVSLLKKTFVISYYSVLLSKSKRTSLTNKNIKETHPYSKNSHTSEFIQLQK